MKNLPVWGYPVQDSDRQKKLEIPFSDRIGISETFNPKKTHPDFAFSRVSIYFDEPVIPMPERVSICIKIHKAVCFDFLPYNHKFYIVSAALWDFMLANGLGGADTAAFATSEAAIVNTKGESLTDKKFYLLRIILRNISNETILDDTQFATESTNNFFIIRHEQYFETIAFNAELKDGITTKFQNPFLYTPAQWRRKNKNPYDKDFERFLAEVEQEQPRTKSSLKVGFQAAFRVEPQPKKDEPMQRTFAAKRLAQYQLSALSDAEKMAVLLNFRHTQADDYSSANRSGLSDYQQQLWAARDAAALAGRYIR